MTLPRVHWSIEGRVTPVSDWSCNCVLGGFDQFRGTILARDALQLPSSIAQGSKVTGYLDSGAVMWEGRLATDPRVQDGLAELAATGHKSRLEKAHDRLLYQTREYQLWQSYADDPFPGTASEALDGESRSAGLFFRYSKNETYGSGDSNHLALWAPGVTLTRYAFTIVKSGSNSSFDIRTRRFTGASGSTTTIQDHSLGAGQPTSIDQSVSSAEDGLTIGLRANAGVTPTSTHGIRIQNLRVNGIASGDSFTAQGVFQDLSTRAGYDSAGVSSSLNLNVLPLDWEGAWSDLADYTVLLQDGYWRVLEDRGSGPYLEADKWSNSKEWNVGQATNARLDLSPLELFNKVVIHYDGTSGVPRQSSATASPDPLATSGLVNVYEEDLSDPQPDSTLAASVASTLLSRYAAQRYTGRIEVVGAKDSGGRGSPYEIRAGDKVTVADWDMGKSFTHRIHEVEYGPDGVSLGIEGDVSSARVLARAALEQARRRIPRRRRR